MKKTVKLIAMALMAGAMFTACGEKTPTTDPIDPGQIPGVTITPPMVGGAIKAGISNQIEINGLGFDPEQDYVYIGYSNGTEVVYERITADVLTLRRNYIGFGVTITAGFLDKTVNVYLDRPEYDRMKISGDITFTMPSVSEGYIPDAAFRATLASTHKQDGNPNIAPLFDSYGLLDVVGAANVTNSGCADGYGLNLYASAAKSLEGIELFTGIKGTIAGWGMTQIEEIDLSKWKNAQGVALMFNNNTTLKKFVGAPYAYRTDLYKCDKLTYVDLSLSKWCYNIQLFYDESPTAYSYVEYLDIRRQRTGKMHTGDENKDYPGDVENDYAVILAGAWMKVAGNCKILVDYQFLLDKRGNASDAGAGYATIFNAWKRGATIEVYNSTDIKKKIGTVPLHSVDSGALTLTGNNGWTPPAE